MENYGASGQVGFPPGGGGRQDAKKLAPLCCYTSYLYDITNIDTLILYILKAMARQQNIDYIYFYQYCN